MDTKLLEKLIDERGFTQEKVAEAADISSVYLSEILNNKRPGISLDIAVRIARAVGVPVSVIAGDMTLEDYQRFQTITRAFKAAPSSDAES